MFFGITYSFISKLDLDSSVSKVIRTRWCVSSYFIWVLPLLGSLSPSCLSSRCRYQVLEDTQTCTNQLCLGRDQALSASVSFDLLVDFTDHSGTLQACSLRGSVAEQTLGCTVSTALKVTSNNVEVIDTNSSFTLLQTEEFTRLTDDQRTALKWRFLLERCKIYVKVLYVLMMLLRKQTSCSRACVTCRRSCRQRGRRAGSEGPSCPALWQIQER